MCGRPASVTAARDGAADPARSTGDEGSALVTVHGNGMRNHLIVVRKGLGVDAADRTGPVGRRTVLALVVSAGLH